MADNSNPIDQALGGGANPIDVTLGGASAASSSSPFGNPIDSALGGGESRPGNGQPPEAVQHLYQDSSQPFYKRAWDWLNTPVTTSLFGMPEEREGAGGLERGVEHIVSGLTSPLSLALTAATFGTGGLIESAGASALKEAGLSAAEIADAVKGSEAAVKAYKDLRPIEPAIQSALEAGGHDLGLLQKARGVFSPLNKDAQLAEGEAQSALSKIGLNQEQRAALDAGKLSGSELSEDATASEIALHRKAEEAARSEIASANGGFGTKELQDLAKTGETVAKAKAGFTPVEDAIREAGADPALYKRADEILAKNGLSVEDLLGGNAFRRGAFHVLRNVVPDLPISVASRAAKTAEFVMNAGFTYQQLEMAAAMSPRFLDALKEGDTDKAWEYGTEAVAGAGLGLLGTSHALHSAGELFKPLVESDKPRLNDQWLAVERANKEREAQHAVAEQQAIKVHEQAIRLLGHEPPRPVLGDSPEVRLKKLQDYAVTELGVHTGMDAAKAAEWHNALAEAAGVEDRVSAPIGTPIPAEAAPSRANTQVLASNASGEVRVGADGRPVVWLGPEAIDRLNSRVHPEANITGFSFSPDESAQVGDMFSENDPIRELIDKARSASKQSLLTGAGTEHPQAVRVVSEELHHTAQRELAEAGEIENHLDPGQWTRLSGIIPEGWTQHMNSVGYHTDPVVRVAETAAQFMAQRHLDLPGTVTDSEVNSFLDNYFKELVAKHGEKAVDAFKNINEIAKQHVEDINAARQTRTGEPETSGVVRPVLRGVEEGREEGDRSGREGSPGRKPEGLASREEDLRRVYHWSRKPLFTETNPELAGTGVRGAERGRPQIKGTYFGDETYREPMVQGNAQKYFADIDYGKIYDRREDPQGLVQQAIELTRKNGDPAEYNFEKLVKQNGFSGYRTGSVVKSFEPVKVHPDYGLTEIRDPNKFRSSMVKAMNAYAESKDPKKIGLDKQPTIYTPEEYKNMRTFLSPDGKVGFALNGDEIVSAFSHPTSPKAAGNIIDVAVANGGRRLEAFDTFLPKLYAEHGFRAVARMPFNDEFAPDGWNYKAMEKFNGGRPDVVFMVHDPAAKGYTPGDGETVSGFPEAEALQRAALMQTGPGNGQAAPAGLYSRDWNHIKQYLSPEEVEKHNTEEKKNSLVAAYNAMPDAQEWSDAVKAGRPGQGEAPELSDRLLNAAGRLEAARTNAAIERHINAKVDNQGQFDFGATDFNPAYFDEAIGSGATPMGAKFMPLYARERTVNPDVQKLETDYTREKGINKFPHEGVVSVNPESAKRIADAYEKMQHNPNDPEVRRAYNALKKETVAQWNAAVKAGYKFEPWTKEGQPYATSEEMAKDVRDNKHLYYFPGGDIPADHPLAGVDPRTGETYNNMFRAVHDLFGHAKNDYEFGPKGEENAFLAHSRMFSDAAIPALLSETKGQNSWVNFGQHIRDENGDIPKKGEPGYVPPPERPYAEQKAGVLPKNIVKEATFASPQGLMSRDRENPVWYLKSNQIVDQKIKGPQPADQVLRTLESGGVKPDELKYTGLDEFLRSKGSEKVRPEEIKNFLDANNLQLQEVTKGEGFNREDEARLSRLENLTRELTPSEEEEMVQLQREASANEGEPAKFGTYVLPGGQNYREMLLTLPGKQSEIPMYRLYNENGEIMGTKEGTPSQTQLDSAKNLGWKIEPFVRKESTGDEFRSSHWDEPNVVGHVRFNDRTGPNGEKLLHLEELQSDWHQKGREKGYKDSDAASRKEEAQRRVNESYEAARDAVERNGRLGFDYRTEALGAVRDHPDWAERWDVSDPKDVEALDRYAVAMRDLEREKRAETGGVPDAPFKKTWPELLMKRMIRYASEHGYDGISWTPGEEQASRYDLSKQVDGITYDPKTGDLYLKHKGADNFEAVPFKTVKSEAELADTIGKEAAKKLISTEAKPFHDFWAEEGSDYPHMKTLSGVDLKVGGEGMKGFYDKIVPDVVNKLGKQFGSRVGETKIEVPPQLGHEKYVYSGPELTPDQLKAVGFDWNAPAVINDQARQVRRAMVDDGLSFQEAVARYGSPSLAHHIGGKMEITKPTTSQSVPYFPITDSMRESVLKGQPLFSREGPGNGQLQNQIDTNKFKDQSPEYQNRVLEALRTIAENRVPENVKAAAKYLREQEDRNAEIGGANDLLHGYVEDHMQRVWKNNNPEGKVIASEAKAGRFATRVSFAQHRVYDSTLTGLLKSPTEMEFDPAHHTAQARAQLIKAAANKQLIDNLRDKFTRASDGRPAVVLSGSGQVVSGPNGENPKTFIDPSRVRKINIAPDVVKQLEKSGDLARYLEDGTIRDITPYVRPDNIGAAIDRLEEQAGGQNAQYDEVGNNTLRTQIMYLKSMMANKDFSGLKEFNESLDKQYAWDPQDYISLDHSAMRGWNFVTNSADGNPVFVRSNILVHPEFAEYLKNRLGLEQGALSKSAIGRAVLSAGTKAKETLLSLSPFHLVQIGLRGLMTGVNPFTLHGPDIVDGAKIDPSDPKSPTKIYKMVEQGMTTGTDYKGQQEYSEGVSSGNPGLLRKVPVVGNIAANAQQFWTDFLFKRYLPAIKATAAEKMFDDYRAKYPEWSVDKVARAAGQHANDSFGGVNWRAMGRAATTQEFARALLLAPDWLESELRSGARLFNKDEGGIGREQVFKMAGAMWLMARVLNSVTTGSPHLEAPFGLAVKNKEGKETVFSIRTLPTDLLHLASQPTNFIKGRLSPTVHLGQELLSGRDNFGRKMAPEDLWADVFRNLLPIPVQSVGQAITSTGPEVGNIGQVWKGVGGTAQTYHTPAAELAANLAASHSEDGIVDPSQQARHRLVMDMEDKVRSGEMSYPDLMKLTYETDQLKEQELKKIQQNLQKTKGLDSSLASLYTRASRLPAKEYLQLLDVANPSEKAALVPLTLQVQRRYLAKAKKEMTPQERAQDPVFQRLLNLTVQRPQQQ